MLFVATARVFISGCVGYHVPCLRPLSVGNVCDVTFEYAYVLEEGQTALPPHLEAAWAEGLKVRKILDANILPGRSALKTLQVPTPHRFSV